jgi:hypothetical protein
MKFTCDRRQKKLPQIPEFFFHSKPVSKPKSSESYILYAAWLVLASSLAMMVWFVVMDTTQISRSRENTSSYIHYLDSLSQEDQ